MRNINYNEVKRGEALGLIMRNCVVLLLLFYYLRLATVIAMFMRLEGYCLCLFIWGVGTTCFAIMMNCGAWGYSMCCYTLCWLCIPCMIVLRLCWSTFEAWGREWTLSSHNWGLACMGLQIWGLACMGLQRGIGLCRAIIY